MRLTLAAAIVAILLPACSENEKCEATEPCALPDLEVTSVSIGPSTGAHPVTGLAVVDSLGVTYTVTNRGGSESDTAVAVIEVGFEQYRTQSVPKLRSGESTTRTVAFSPPQPGYEY